jgi:hypothetical protein
MIVRWSVRYILSNDNSTQINVNKIRKQAVLPNAKDAHQYYDASLVVRIEVRGLWVELRKQQITKNKSITHNGYIVIIVWFEGAFAMQPAIYFTNNGYERAASLFLYHNHQYQHPLTSKTQLRQCGGGRPAAVPIPPRLQRAGHSSGSRIADIVVCTQESEAKGEGDGGG